MIAARRSGIDILLVDDDGRNASQGQIAGQPRTGHAGTDDKYLGLHRPPPFPFLRAVLNWQPKTPGVFACERVSRMLLFDDSHSLRHGYLFINF